MIEPALVSVAGGHVTLVSPQDFELVSRYRWCLAGNYVNGRVEGETTFLHRFLTGAVAGQVVDHIDGNPLNNTRENLRLCTQSQNLANSRARTRQYKGVRPHRGGWAARIATRESPINLGTFDTIEEAATAYDCAARARFGEFARVNFEELRPMPLTRREKALASGRSCRVCGRAVSVESVGRPRLYCSNLCSKRARIS